ncbi:TerC family protein [Candidatus Avelusimicrobium gallicola]|uniref:Tellurium resistance protein TerC n=1 Tax=Candidatus Avelusimicrobium gallicola TaxID=2562704 RepID=A0A1Y4DH21_9BACT|nr:TerC family protein [Elusimicrobium sp. An273]OUO56228.1 tellurium resistance protein TerC [Elusimicrobium sp. An273]
MEPVTTTVSVLMWIAFWVIVLTALFVDLAVLNKHHGKVNMKEAALMVCAWVSLALLFGGAIWLVEGPRHALEFYTGYVLEYSLSIDNMFVFIMIFGYFAIPHELQPKALLWGILGAVVMRFIFIFLGVKLISMFSWTIYVFGALLIFTAAKMLLQKEDEKFDPSQAFVLKALKKVMPLKTDYHGENFFVLENAKRYATPLFAAVLVIEMSDLIFAVDSIPAVLSITQDTFLVYSSNIFAIIGLRSLYFLLSGMAGKFPYLKYGISVILFFVGVKMLISHHFKIPVLASLGVIVAILAVSILASKFFPPKPAQD